MKLKKFENINFNDVDVEEDNSICWSNDNIKKLIKYHEGELKTYEDELEESSYPPGEQQAIDETESKIRLLEEMIDKRSWFVKHFH